MRAGLPPSRIRTACMIVSISRDQRENGDVKCGFRARWLTALYIVSAELRHSDGLCEWSSEPPHWGNQIDKETAPRNGVIVSQGEVRPFRFGILCPRGFGLFCQAHERFRYPKHISG
jgi:hypothetical protein